MPNGNLFHNRAAPASGERFDTLLAHGPLLIERIVSSPRIVQQEYCQQQDEWVVLLAGEAQLQVAGERRTLRGGDYLFLPAGTPHRVESASDGALWLAVHLYPACANSTS
ncbi:cupin domain-containing protein [Chitinilyticum piscinae]|uniref:Cupin domain-containing protein n=1 Tax=Chitinilyticum piscinae TaxID=2866724 RepID=A0A8J7G0T1_9NEIS|nr:cupin domain-containing protein [Chitinilyticum piscinae]MBE9609278.1 cupin domain-containing protein [Chitinilyticum piscinae]